MSNTAVTRNTHVMKGMTACQRCRRRKQRCDQKYPNCSNCESAHVPCLTYHSGKRAEIPRNYVSHLEMQVETLTHEVQTLRTLSQSSSASHSGGHAPALETSTPASDGSGSSLLGRTVASEAGSQQFQDLVKSVKNVVVEPSRQPRFLGQSGGITLARLVMAAIHVDNLQTPLFSENEAYETSLSGPAPVPEASLPPRHVADHLAQVYFQFRSPHLPIVDRAQVDDAFKSAYLYMSDHSSSDRAFEKDIFTAFMIVAIALCDVPSPSGGRSTQREGCFRSAVGLIEKVITYSRSDLETVRAILLLCQFVARCPSWGSLWHLTGNALRLCIDIGLHWETEVLDMDPSLLQERRRLWYSTYQLDRLLSITLGRPVGITDESTHVQLPDPCMASYQLNEFDIHSQRAHNHLIIMSKLESEIKHVQNSQSWTPTIAYPTPNYSDWIKDIQPRLQEWYITIPPPSKAHPDSIFACQAFWDTIYNSSILLLYRPNSISLLSTEELLISFEASCKLIISIKFLQREGKIDILWKSVHTLFMAGLGVIYGLWYSKEIRDTHPLRDNISTLQACASTLSAMSENFPGAVGCRDAFETLSSATVDWLLTNDAEKVRQSRVEFEAQVRDLLQQLQPSRGGMAIMNQNNDMSSMLSNNNFALSEMLSSAAQWPDFPDMDESDIVPHHLSGGINPGSHIF
ncbi:fungal-specific transcription factor domain-containing protein [Talaromyces proteolyticus]|uniref:Fungal-specific transcription factor domain-containing protein n=1 Tax=Talaromyces proteolyticus TaxID=1131652 RepID=A0AAD4KS16_9EURO|nr:fungal-specific transcription factor domain-containing protein [Talaromyces proteolyticus]KAH8694247.1 fungal-specific transcription factor domain-containing protein [Talaromyces proteolyticus]